MYISTAVWLGGRSPSPFIVTHSGYYSALITHPQCHVLFCRLLNSNEIIEISDEAFSGLENLKYLYVLPIIIQYYNIVLYCTIIHIISISIYMLNSNHIVIPNSMAAMILELISVLHLMFLRILLLIRAVLSQLIMKIRMSVAGRGFCLRSFITDKLLHHFLF